MTDLRVRVYGVLAKRRKDESQYRISNSQFPRLKRRGLSGSLTRAPNGKCVRVTALFPFFLGYWIFGVRYWIFWWFVSVVRFFSTFHAARTVPVSSAPLREILLPPVNGYARDNRSTFSTYTREAAHETSLCQQGVFSPS